MSSFNELEMKVIRWAEERRILQYGNSKTQLLKTASEFGALCDALIKRDQSGVRDGIGDVLVTLIIVADLEGTNLLECLEHAWEEIKDRRGRLNANGVFEKEVA
jgi:hypothetical protein